MPKRPSDYDMIAKGIIEDMHSKRRPSSRDMDFIGRAHSLRSPKARAVDEGMTRNLTNIPELWLDDPARFDFWGVDTKKVKKNKGVAKRR